MAVIKKVISVLFVIFLIFFVIAVIWVIRNGKSFIEIRAGLLLKRPVTVRDADFLPPLGLRLKDLNIEGFLFAPEVNVHFGWIAPFGDTVGFRQVDLFEPVLTLHRNEHEGKVQLMPREVNWPLFGAAQAAWFKAVNPTVIRRLTVRSGKVFFPGHDQEDSLSFFVQELWLKASNVPLSDHVLGTTFELKGKLIGDEMPLSGHTIEGTGTLNWFERNMDARIVSSSSKNPLDLEVRLTSRNNDMRVEGRVNSARVFDTGVPRSQLAGNVPAAAVSPAGSGFEMQFSFSTKMDRWELRNIEFSGNLGPSNSARSAVE